MTALSTPVTITEDLDERLAAMSDQLDDMATELQAQRAQREMLSELVGELAHVAGPAVQLLTERLAALEERGWFEFAGHSAGIAEKVVEAFDGEDIDALGDNVVTILEVVRQMTQPDVMAMVGRATADLRQVVTEDTPAPSLPHLLRELRDPQIKRGFERMLVVMRSMGEEASHDE